MFNGTVKPGMEAAMRDWVESRLAPLWRQFDRAETVNVCYERKADPAGPTIPLMLVITYADEAAVEAALASPARYTSRDLLPEFYDQFFEDVTLWHYTMTD